jgi:hypothetical protein
VILENGIIRTMEPSVPALQELAIDGDIVVDWNVSQHKAERVDLGRRCVIPGLTDSHTHFPTWSMTRSLLDLHGCRSLAEAVERVRAAAAEAPGDGWLVGYGWSSAQWESARAPSREDLDPVTGAVPVALWSKDMHTYWVNSAGIARAGADLRVGGGVVETNASGEPTGILREEAAWRFRERQLRVPVEDYADAVIQGIAVAHARGVTAVHDKDGWLGAPEIWSRVRDRGALTLRVWQSVPHDQASRYAGARADGDLDDSFLRVGYLKVFVDGSLGSGTAMMLDGTGVTTTSGHDLVAIIRTAAAAGWPVAVHAIGDKANRVALDAFEATREQWQPRGLRQRVEHAQHLHPDDVSRFAALGIACSVQFTDGVLSRDAVDRLPRAVAAGSFAFRSLWESGAFVVNGSDAPLTELDPLLGIRAAVLGTLDERPGWRPQQALTVQQTLEASTVNPAWLCGDEHRRGRLVPGQLADLVVLDRDPVRCPPDELADVGVVATMVGGSWVHNAPPWD